MSNNGQERKRERRVRTGRPRFRAGRNPPDVDRHGTLIFVFDALAAL
ncbi:MAG: hypothetical protein ACR2MP_31925 [Streptosporangiaceae bacterium]